MTEPQATFLQRHGVIRFTLRTIKFFVGTTAWSLMLGGFAAMVGYFYFAHDLPNIQTMSDYRPPVVSEVFASDGTKIGEFWTERRLIATLDQIPKVLIRAFLAAEDARFFEHRGVDIVGIGRALWEDIKAGEFVQGGSTITQQITRSILLTKEKKLGRKVREIILATRLERNLNKEQILTLYLNQIYLGNRSYGVRSASENYFHKSMDQLTLAEAAMIAGLSKAPTDDAPNNNPGRAKERQLYVLNQMLERGYISRSEHDQSTIAPLTFYEAGIDKDFNIRYTPYFTEHVRRQIAEQYGDKVLYEGGLRIESTVDIEKYLAAEQAVRAGLEALDQRRGWRGALQRGIDPVTAKSINEEVHQIATAEAGERKFHIPEAAEDALRETGPTPLQPLRNYRAVVTAVSGRTISIHVGHNAGTIAPEHATRAGGRIQTGDVIEVRTLGSDGAYELVQTPEVQGALFSMEVKTGYVRAMIGGYDYRLSEFDRSTQALRQPGSSFKPFVYAAALDKGFTYDTPVADAPVAYRVGHEVWAPKNYGGKFSGMGHFASHIAFSRNVPTVRIAHSIGLHYLTGFCRKMGLTNPFQKYLSMALGANDVYLHEMVNAYVNFGNYGRKTPEIFITKITDVTGKEVFTAPILSDEPPATVVVDNGRLTPSSDLNQDLWQAAQQTIEKDKLDLDPQEIQVLYGDRIPEGYVVTPQTAHLIVGLMQKVVKEGTARRMLALGKPLAGKTGTTNDESDTWFIGFTPKLAAGVWIGFDVRRHLGHGEQGGRTAAPVVLQYLQSAVKDDPPFEFEPPPGFPTTRIAQLSGGSAVYWHGGVREESETLEGYEEDIAGRRMTNPASEYFMQDMGDY
ncbi:MAG: PBP1A family penicillin-binding protein [Deltaproteobacteria bacterium]|nr:PBP1A family penicillin-binding protein [Deltaproteobacteria bacterium]